jgi:hypothetical protein
MEEVLFHMSSISTHHTILTVFELSKKTSRRKVLRGVSPVKKSN